MPWDAPGATAIMVLSPESEAIVGDLYRAHSKAGSEGMTPHVTLLVPFVPAARLDEGVHARLVGLLRQFQPFDYVLERLERFPDGVLYLAPEPPGPFVALVEALVQEFPDYPPYDGAHAEIVPHVTVAVSDDDSLLAGIARGVEPKLPLRCRAADATVVERGADLRWRSRTSFRLGGG